METSVITADPDGLKRKQQEEKEKSSKGKDKSKNVEISTDNLFKDDIYEFEEERKELEKSMKAMSGELERTKEDLRSALQLLDHTQELSSTGSFEIELTDGKIKGSKMFREILGMDEDVDTTIDMMLSTFRPNDADRINEFVKGLHEGSGIQENDFKYINSRLSKEMNLLIRTITLPSELSGDKKIIGIVQEISETIDDNTGPTSSKAESVSFSGVMMERELRIIEMKKEVNELCKELGIKPHYSDFEK